MIPLDESTNIFVCGPVCSGKTNLLNTWLSTHNRYVRFDYTGETTGNAGIVHVYNPHQLLDEIEKRPYYFRIAYHPGKNVMEHYRWCQRVVWMFDAPRVLGMDEFHRVCPQTTKLDEDMETALRMARHNQLSIIGLSQRPQDVHKLFVDSCRRCIIYRSQEGNFLDACANHWGDDVAECVETLRPLVHNDVTKITKQVPQCVVVTRDGSIAQVYDFKTDSYVTVTEFLEGKQPEGQTNTEEQEEDGPTPHSTDNGTTGTEGDVPDNSGIEPDDNAILGE
jgi:hypothetical protein